MPNIKSAIKRVEVSEKKRQENKMIKSKLNTYIKKLKTAVSENQLVEAQELYKEVVSLLDKAAKDNVIHKNSASRKEAALARLMQK